MDAQVIDLSQEEKPLWWPLKLWDPAATNYAQYKVVRAIRAVKLHVTLDGWPEDKEGRERC